VRHDSTEENLRQLRHYVEQHGRPLAVYTDKASLFQIAPRAIHHRDAPEQQLTQIGRALQELNIEWIAAHSPGRIERAFQTAQDRLVKGLRQAGAKDLAPRTSISSTSTWRFGTGVFGASRNWLGMLIGRCCREPTSIPC